MDEATRLLVAARDGHDHAFTSFVRVTQADLWRFCAYLAEPESADDLAQETYLRAFRALGAYRGDAPALPWLLSIARRTVADEFRRRTRRRRALAAMDPPPTSASPDAGLAEIHSLLEPLDPDRRAAFVLTQLLGFSYADAAEVCGCRVGTIRSRVARARDHLLRLVDDEPVRRWSNGER